jgi:uncharacterized YccA/Bax inhibitor family protein
MRTANPALNAKVFEESRVMATRADAMTIEGTVNKTGTSLLVLLACASLQWNAVFGEELLLPLTLVGLIGGSVVALVTVFKKAWAPVTTMLYAALEGLCLGGCR